MQTKTAYRPFALIVFHMQRVCLKLGKDQTSGFAVIGSLTCTYGETKLADEYLSSDQIPTNLQVAPLR